MKVFLTGASGVIGSRVLPVLVSAGHAVTTIARTPEKRSALERSGARVSDVDLFDVRKLRDAVQGHDAVVNLATHMPSSASRMFLPGAWSENDRIRREGSTNLVRAAIAGGAQRFVQESFAPVYPDRGDAWIDEHVPLEPVRYNRTIVDAERSAARFEDPSRTSVVLRFAAFYGPDSRFLNEMIGAVRYGWAPMPGAPEAFISSVSHDDAASAVIAALSLPAGTYNVCDDEPVTHREYFDSLAAALGVPAPKLPPAWLGLFFGSVGRMAARSLRMSNGKLRSACAWVPRYRSVREGWRSLGVAAAAARAERSSWMQKGFR